MVTNPQCIVCDTFMNPGSESWHFVCPHCRYEAGNLRPTINSTASADVIDESARAQAFIGIRQRNFSRLIELLRSLQGDARRKLLDVGAAHGWFLQLAQPHFDVVGIEPDEAVGRRAMQSGVPIRLGYFPQAVDDGERFDIIVFNDVIEHIPDIRATLAACRRILNQDGLLLINLPSSTGFFYRMSKFLHAIGLSSAFGRMWQKGFPSPHVHYFSLANLDMLVAAHGFERVAAGFLPAVELAGLWQRVSYARNSSVLARCVQFALIVAVSPVLRLMPKDICYAVFLCGKSPD